MSAKRRAEPQKPGQNQLKGSAKLLFRLTPVIGPGLLPALYHPKMEAEKQKSAIHKFGALPTVLPVVIFPFCFGPTGAKENAEDWRSPSSFNQIAEKSKGSVPKNAEFTRVPMR